MATGPTRMNSAAELALKAAAKQIDWAALEAITHRDPAGRGVASHRRAGTFLDEGSLREAAVDLAFRGSRVGIVTGFCAILEEGVTAETDGPPGALFLARFLRQLGIEAYLITDRYARPLLEVGCDAAQMDRNIILTFPFESDLSIEPGRAANEAGVDGWVEEFFTGGPGRGMSHLIAIERPGPSHTLDSFSRQPRAGLAPLAQFEAEVPRQDRDVCHNMRARSIEAFTAKTHCLFERIAEHGLPITTLGIGDGGNEIGMGSFAWETLCEAIDSPPAGKIVCRIATDFTLLAGVSNWGGYGLALAVAQLLGRVDLVSQPHESHQRRLIEAMVRETPAVDGITLRREATVDGLPLDAYLEPLAAMRRLLTSQDGS